VGATFRVALLSDHGGQHFHADKKEVGKGNLVVPGEEKLDGVQVKQIG
jgi:hypothetical protein